MKTWFSKMNFIKIYLGKSNAAILPFPFRAVDIGGENGYNKR